MLIKSPQVPMVFGFSWLQRHNPLILTVVDWCSKAARFIPLPLLAPLLGHPAVGKPVKISLGSTLSPIASRCKPIKTWR